MHYIGLTSEKSDRKRPDSYCCRKIWFCFNDKQLNKCRRKDSSISHNFRNLRYLLWSTCFGTVLKPAISHIGKNWTVWRVVIYMISVVSLNLGYFHITTWRKVEILARYSKKGTGFNFCDTKLPYHNIIWTKVTARYMQFSYSYDFGKKS